MGAYLWLVIILVAALGGGVIASYVVSLAATV